MSFPGDILILDGMRVQKSAETKQTRQRDTEAHERDGGGDGNRTLSVCLVWLLLVCAVQLDDDT